VLIDGERPSTKELHFRSTVANCRGQCDPHPPRDRRILHARHARTNQGGERNLARGRDQSGATTFFVDGSDTKVEEFRSELQISDVWPVLPNLTLEPGFRFEASRIEQDINNAASPDRHIERKFEQPCCPH
jgi:hypothetical protein